RLLSLPLLCKNLDFRIAQGPVIEAHLVENSGEVPIRRRPGPAASPSPEFETLHRPLEGGSSRAVFQYPVEIESIRLAVEGVTEVEPLIPGRRVDGGEKGPSPDVHAQLPLPVEGMKPHILLDIREGNHHSIPVVDLVRPLPPGDGLGGLR